MAKKCVAKYKSGRTVSALCRPPKGWRKTKGATTAPVGFAWYNNGKSRFSGERRIALVKKR